MEEPEAEGRRSWAPLVMAGVVVAFALIVALLAFAANREGDASQARTVDDVAELAIEAADRADTDLARQLACRDGGTTAYVGEQSAHAEKSAVTGRATGSFHLLVHGVGEFDVRVERSGERSCVAGVVQTG